MLFSLSPAAAGRQPAHRLFLPLQWDFSLGIPSVQGGQSFDFIVSACALHHLADDARVHFISSLLNLLETKGAILVGDVCSRTREDLLLYKDACGDNNGEACFVFSEVRERLSPICGLAFHEFSFCSGVIEIRKKI